MRHAVVLALLLAGCVVHERAAAPPPPPPPPAPAAPEPRLISEREAVQVAADFARARGLEVRRYKAKLDPQGRQWRVQMKGEGGKDRAWVVVDARSGKVLRAKLRDTDKDKWD